MTDQHETPNQPDLSAFEHDDFFHLPGCVCAKEDDRHTQFAQTRRVFVLADVLHTVAVEFPAFHTCSYEKTVAATVCAVAHMNARGKSFEETKEYMNTVIDQLKVIYDRKEVRRANVEGRH